MELPLAGEVVEASVERPYLSFRLVLDPTIATSVMVDSGIVHPRGDSSVIAVNVSPLDANLLDATLRLVRLIDATNEYRVLAPLIIREIVYRLLTGSQGNRMRHLARFGGHAHRMARRPDAAREFRPTAPYRGHRTQTRHERLRVPRPLQDGYGYESLAVPEAATASGSPAAHAQRRSRRGGCWIPGRVRRCFAFQPRIQAAFRQAANARHRRHARYGGSPRSREQWFGLRPETPRGYLTSIHVL